MSSNTFQMPNYQSRTSSNAFASTSSSTSSAAAAVADSAEYDMSITDQESTSTNDGGARVYWYAPPSPSLQLQQAEHQRLMARARAIQPMASQAFRDELLGSMTQQPKKEERDSERSTRLRKVSRRGIRKSTTGSSNDETTKNSRISGLNENNNNMGIDRILDDLDQHLMHSKRIGVFSDDNENGKEERQQSQQKESYLSLCFGKDVEADRLQQDLIDGMDRAFSQEIKVPLIISSTLPTLSRSAKNWSRTTSMPVQPFYGKASQVARLAPLEDQECYTKNMTSNKGKRTFPHSPENGEGHMRRSSFDDMFASPSKPVAHPIKNSPNKRRAATITNKSKPLQEQDLNSKFDSASSKQSKGHFSRTVSDGAPLIRGNDVVKEESTPFPRDDHNSTDSITSLKHGMKKSTSAHFQRSAPRLGLSRSAALSASKQQRVMSSHSVLGTFESVDGNNTNQHFGNLKGPNAPFKRPTLKSPPKSKDSVPQNSTQNIKRSQSNTSEVVVIDDSSDEEDLAKKDKKQIKPTMRSIGTSTTTVVEKFSSDAKNNKKSIEPASSNSIGEVSFDTSLDDEALCDVLDAVEASQSALTVEQKTRSTTQTNISSKDAIFSQNSQKQIQPKSDDSFDTSIDDDVSAAILSHMEAEGW